ncbi:unnamed protein product [Protopolystoma xenopodis]|uniref:Uncharacterized protein n=1 Tax=Protopolystoma xenopodis TaxID=117903 RepID=A0A3S5BU68_9PLAT|nr:unnamed protein product [Protopolystoma xenopodis]
MSQPDDRINAKQLQDSLNRPSSSDEVDLHISSSNTPSCEMEYSVIMCLTLIGQITCIVLLFSTQREVSQ